MRYRYLSALVVVSILGLCATSLFAGASDAATQPKKTASQFVVETVWQSIRGQYGRVWAKLDPAYKKVTTRARWEACQRRKADALGGDWLSMTATDEYSDRVILPLLGNTAVTAVSLEGRVRLPQSGVRRVRTTLYVRQARVFNPGNVVLVWRGLWTPEQYRAYKAGRCPD